MKKKKKFRIIFGLILLVVLLGLVGFKLWASQNADAAWFNSSWTFRQKIPVTAHTGAETNVYFTPNTFDSSDTTKFQADCGDLRFTDANGNLLPYFIVSGCGTGTTTVHVLVANFPAGAQDFYMYYGNPTVTNGFSSADFATAATGVTLGSNGSEEKGIGPTMYWKFDEGTGTSAGDSSSNSNTGTLGGTTVPAWKTEDLCVNGKCLFFDGSTSKVTGSKISKNIQSVAFWIRPNTIASQGILNFDGGTHKISTDGSGVVTATGFTSPTYYLNGKSVTTLTLVQNTWNYVEITTGTGFDSTNSFTVGTDGTNFIKGLIDEVQFYNYARSASQVQVDYNTGAEQLGKVNQKTFLSNGLVGYWELDEGSGNAADSSGNGLTLTNNGTTTFVQGKFGNAPLFNGSSKYFSSGSTISNVQTISFWAKPSSTTDNYINLASGVYINSSSGTISATGITSPTIYVNGVVSSTISASTWSFVTVTTNTAIASANAFEIGRANGSFAANNSKIDEVRTFNRALSASDVANLYNWAPSPVGWWKFDDGTGTSNTIDSSTNSYTGTLAGMTSASWVSGKYGRALRFDGTTSKVTISSVTASVTRLQGTMSTWIYRTFNNTDPIFPAVFSMGGNADNNLVEAYYDGGAHLWHFHYTDGSSDVDISTTADDIARNTWEYLTLTWDKDADLFNVYVNGVLIGTQSSLPTTSTWSTAFIGCSADAPCSGSFFPGTLDDVKIYNYPRTPAQIREDMVGENSGSVAGANIKVLPSPLMWWKFNDLSTVTANDSNSGVFGTLSATSLWTANGCKSNGCVNITSSSSNISATAGETGFLDGAANLTFTTWINPQTLATTNNIISKAGTATQREFQILTDSGTSSEIKVMVASSGSDTSNYCVTSGLGLTTATWQHLSIVYDGTQSNANRIKVYKNARLITCTVTGTIPTSFIASSTSNLRIGKGDDSANGLLSEYDDFKIYTASLTPDQIKTDYNEASSINYGTGQATEASLLTDGAGNAAVGYWNMDDNGGAIANDTSGNNNNGIITAGAGGWVPGKVGSAYNFDGTATKIVPPNSISGVRSVSFWVNPTSTTSNMLQLSASVYVSASSGTISGTGFSSPTIYVNGVVSSTLVANRWQYVTVTSASGIGSANAIQLGFANSVFFSGKLDDVKFYDYTRTASQVMYDYNRGAPMGWWKFDECQGSTVNDSSGNSNSGTITIGAGAGTGHVDSVGTCNTSSTAWGNGASGKFNSSLSFDGIDDYVQAGSNPITGSSAFTLSGWLNAGTHSDYGIAAFIGAASSGQSAYIGWVTTANVGSNNSVGGGFYGRNYGSGISTSGWHHVVLTFSGGTNGTALLYVDGIQKTSDTQTPNLQSTSVYFGRTNTGTQYWYHGSLDDTRIYNYALSLNQIKILYNQGSAVRFGPVTGAP